MGIHRHPVLVIGAGPTGLAVAIEMARMGLPVRIVDKGSGPAQWSQALVVQARTLEQFERYGIAAEVVAAGRPIRHAEMFHGGHRFLNVDLARIAGRYPYILFLPQSETEAMLLAHLRALGIEVERDTELVHFEDAGDGGIATVQRTGSIEEAIRYRWLIGCDGAHSTVRHQSQIPFEGDTVSLRFFLGDVTLSGPDTPGDSLVIHFQKGDALFLARMKNDITRVIVVQHDAQGPGDNRVPEIADFQRWIDAFGLRMRVETSVWSAPFHINERKAARYRKGSVFLAGDASHIHSPVGGQGMNTGLQDAANLAWKLAAVAGSAPEALLDSYEEERGAVGDALLARTSRGLQVGTSTNPATALLRDLAGSVVSHLPWAQRQVLGFIAETAIQYRDSSVVQDHGGAGSLQAGDRVPNPDVTLADGSRQRLLAQLIEAKHLLIAGQDADTRALREAVPAASLLLLADKQQAEVSRLFGEGEQIRLVRPDGYLGFRGNVRAAAAYARNVGLQAT